MNDWSDSKSQRSAGYIDTMSIIDDWARKNNIVVNKVAVVASVNTAANTATVFFDGDNKNPSCSYPNKTGTALGVGNKVYVFYRYGSASQGWILIKA